MMEHETRQRLVDAMALQLQRCGLHGAGLNELLGHAGAPKGVLYHHFPGGKTALALAAIEAMRAKVLNHLDQALAREDGPLAGLEAWVVDAAQRLARSGFERGCPFAAVALETGAQDATLREALARTFVAIRGRIAEALRNAGLGGEADAFAALLVSSYEGGLLQARVEGNSEAFLQGSRALLSHLRTRARLS